MKEKTREYWIDYMKIFACVLVVLGHLFQSLTKSGILYAGFGYELFNQSLYFFHVQLFFICSGYLYQKNNIVNSADTWKQNVIRKALDFGIPYFVFATITWLLKILFSSAVNDQVGSWFYTMFVCPIAPYWYLVCLFFLFVISPTIKSQKTVYIMGILALLGKWYYINTNGVGPFVLETIGNNWIWFLIGMCFEYYDLHNIKKNVKKIICAICFLMAIPMFYINVYYSIENGYFDFFVSIISCVAFVYCFNLIYENKEQGKLGSLLIRITMPVFLMHTIFAAPVRTIMYKIGISNSIVHIIVGLIVSYIGPMLVIYVFEKMKWPMFFIYPRRFIKRKKGE